jgi:type VI secretion system secreted protein Hcp
MPIQTFIKIDGVDGESTSKDHRGEIEALSWNWGVTGAPVPSSGGAGAGKATPGEFVFTHLYDKASPLLAKKAASGVHIANVVLSARKSGQGQKDFLTVTMKEVFVTTVSVGGDPQQIVEAVSLVYRNIEFAYKPQNANGSLGAAVKFGWDTKTGQIT